MYKKISSKYIETKAGLYYISYVCIAVLLVSYFVLIMDKDYQYQTALSVLISSALLGAGWWVQATITSSNARKTHTITTIMNQRNSEVFFRKNDNVVSTFSMGKTVHPVVAMAIFNKNRDELINITLPQAYIKASNDLLYLLNYYEFIAAGVFNGDLDEKLIRECYENIIIGLEKRAFHIICEARKSKGERVFVNFTDLIDKWSDKGSLVNLKIKHSQDVSMEIHPLHPSNDEVENDCTSSKSSNSDSVSTSAGGTKSRMASINEANAENANSSNVSSGS